MNTFARSNWANSGFILDCGCAAAPGGCVAAQAGCAAALLSERSGRRRLRIWAGRGSRRHRFRADRVLRAGREFRRIQQSRGFRRGREVPAIDIQSSISGYGSSPGVRELRPVPCFLRIRAVQRVPWGRRVREIRAFHGLQLNFYR